jgi:hypothetical protein
MQQSWVGWTEGTNPESRGTIVFRDESGWSESKAGQSVKRAFRRVRYSCFSGPMTIHPDRALKNFEITIGNLTRGDEPHGPEQRIAEERTLGIRGPSRSPSPTLRPKIQWRHHRRRRIPAQAPARRFPGRSPARRRIGLPQSTG